MQVISATQRRILLSQMHLEMLKEIHVLEKTIRNERDRPTHPHSTSLELNGTKIPTPPEIVV